MPIQVKNGDIGGGSWRAAVASGNLRFKQGPVGSGVWVGAGTCKVWIPAGGGQWKDSGYVGYPYAPSAPYVVAWDYSTVTVGWNSPVAGGPVIDHYHIVQANEGGGWLNQANVGGNTSPAWAVSLDARYQYLLQSVATNGLASAWQGPLRVQIGHPATDNYGYVEHTRPWSATQNGNWWRERYDGANPGGTVVFVPNTVFVNNQVYDVYPTNNFTQILSPYGERTISDVVASVDQGNVKHMANPPPSYHYRATEYRTGWGGDGWWGPKLHGTGWTSTDPNGPWRMLGTFTVNGTEHYQNYEVVSTNPAVGNSYW